MSNRLKIGIPINWAGDRTFNHSKWCRDHPTEVHISLSATAPGYRERKARQLLSRLDAGLLSPEAAAGVERDYAKELAELRKKRATQ